MKHLDGTTDAFDLKPATFGWLCVETMLLLNKAGSNQTIASHLRVAVC